MKRKSNKTIVININCNDSSANVTKNVLNEVLKDFDTEEVLDEIKKEDKSLQNHKKTLREKIDFYKDFFVNQKKLINTPNVTKKSLESLIDTLMTCFGGLFYLISLLFIVVPFRNHILLHTNYTWYNILFYLIICVAGFFCGKVISFIKKCFLNKEHSVEELLNYAMLIFTIISLAASYFTTFIKGG